MSTEETLRRATLLSDLGRYEEADRHLALVLADEPDSEPGLALHARGLVARRRFHEAADTTTRLLRSHPESLRGLLGMARIEGLLGRPWDGVAFARRAVALYPDDELCLVVLADVLNRVRPGSAEAMALLDEALRIEPEDATAYRLYGELYLDVAQYEQAERWTLRALRVAPENSTAILQLGLVRAGLGRFAESRDQVLAALRMDAKPANIRQVVEHVEGAGIPDHLAELYALAMTALGRPDLSRPGSAGRDPELLAEQAALARRMSSMHATPEGHRRAAGLADAVLAEDPGNQPARYVRSRALSAAERYAEALPLAEALCREGFAPAADALMVAQSGLGDHEAALATIRRALRDTPDSSRHLAAQSLCLRHLERYDEALASATRAAELSPIAPGVQLERGVAARAAGDLPLAEAALREALGQYPRIIEPVAWLALVCAETGRWPEAEALMVVVASDTSDPRSLVHPCTELANLCLMSAVPSLDGVDEVGGVDEDAPDPALLTEGTRWLTLALDMYVTAARGYREGEADFFAMWSRAHAVLHKIRAPEDSDFGRFLRRLDGTMDDWRRT